MLLYDYEPLFLRESETVSGNVVFSGANSIYQRDSSYLTETQLVTKADSSNSAVYINQTTQKYLQYFFQRGQFVGQIGIPFGEHSEDEVLNKLKDVVKVMNPNDKVILESTVESLAPATNPASLWRDPYIDVYAGGRGFLPLFSMRLKDTPFQEEAGEQTNARSADISYAYEGSMGNVWLSVTSDVVEREAEESASA